MTYTTPDTIIAGALVPVTSMNKWTNGLVEQQQGMTSLFFTPAGSLNTSTTTAATWMTCGNVTVPTWATGCIVQWTVSGYTQTVASGTVTFVQLKIGSAAGQSSRRIPSQAVTGGRYSMSFADQVTGLTSGTQSVTLLGTWSSGTSAFSVDGGSTFSATFLFQ